MQAYSFCGRKLKSHWCRPIPVTFVLIFALDKLNVRHISTSALVDLLT